MIIHCPVATSLTWHLAPGLANSKGEGVLTSSLSIVWWPHCQLQHGNSGSHHRCLMSMWLVVRLVMWHCNVSCCVMVVGGGVEEVKVATRWGCMGVVDDGGG